MDTAHLKREYEKEKARLNSLCDKWQTILDSQKRKIYSEDVKGAILSVLGQSRLLLNQKLRQFERLLSDGEQQCLDVLRGGGPVDAPPIKLQDLEGFWEVVMLQVHDVYNKFSNLEDMDIYTKKSYQSRLSNKK